MDADPSSQSSARATKWIVILTVLGIALAVLAFLAFAIFQHPVTIRCTGFTRGNYGPQFIATNHTDKPILINLVSEHREAGGWIADTNWPVGINLLPHASGNCFADNKVKSPWRVHVIVFSDIRDQLPLMPRLRSFFLMRRMVRLGTLGLPVAPGGDFMLAPSQELFIPGPTPLASSSE